MQRAGYFNYYAMKWGKVILEGGMKTHHTHVSAVRENWESLCKTPFLDCRCITHWMNRDVDNAIKGYNINLQNMMGSKMPNSVLQMVVKHTYFRKSAKRVKAAGFGGYTNDEMDAMGQRDLKVLSEQLGDKQFFFGDEPRSLDLKAFVALALLLNVEAEVACPLRDYVDAECKNLAGVFNRMKVRIE